MVGIHIVNRKAQVTKAIITKTIIAAGGDKDTVTTAANIIILDD